MKVILKRMIRFVDPDNGDWVDMLGGTEVEVIGTNANGTYNLQHPTRPTLTAKVWPTEVKELK